MPFVWGHCAPASAAFIIYTHSKPRGDFWRSRAIALMLMRARPRCVWHAATVCVFIKARAITATHISHTGIEYFANNEKHIAVHFPLWCVNMCGGAWKGFCPNIVSTTVNASWLLFERLCPDICYRFAKLSGGFWCVVSRAVTIYK